MNKYIEYITDEEFLKNIRTSLIVLFAMSFGFMYFGFITNINWNAIFTFEISGMAISLFLSVYIPRLEIKHRAIDVSKRKNDLVIKLDKEIQQEIDNVNDIDKVIEFTDQFNLTETNRIRSKKLVKKRDKINKKITHRKLRKKDYTKYSQKLERLQLENMSVWNYNPIKYSDLLGDSSSSSKSNVRDRKSINYNPLLDGEVTVIILTVLKFCGFAGGISMPFILNVPITTIIAYYSILAISLGIGLPKVYLTTKLRMVTRYLPKRKEKLLVLKALNEYIKKDVIE